MTRLDATSEPSMEDILASIRKIIAEDPPGSRVAPAAPQPSTSQPSLRANDRDRFAPFGSRDSDASAAPAQSATTAHEPYLKATPEPSKTAFGSEPYFSSTPASNNASSFAAPSSVASRIEPSFGTLSGSLPSDDAETAAQSHDLSVDAQLSDLLGETASVSIKPASMAPTALGFGDRMAGRANAAPAAEQTSRPLEARPGFTVSRDGFVGAKSDVPAAAEPDPFDFDLGPSPFQNKTAEQAAAPAIAPAPTGNSLTARMSASSLERISAPSVAATIAASDGAAAPTAAEPIVSAAPEPTPTATASATIQQPIEPAVETPLAPIAAPSVAATIAPKSYEPAPAPEPVARFIPANASVEAPKQVDHDVLEVVSAQRNDVEVMRVAAETDAHDEPPREASSSTAIAIAAADGQMRSMEDTVAELLRPMLKAWLAENMPRIVERALRRELSEKMLGDKKAAAE